MVGTWWLVVGGPWGRFPVTVIGERRNGGTTERGTGTTDDDDGRRETGDRNTATGTGTLERRGKGNGERGTPLQTEVWGRNAGTHAHEG